MYTVYQKTSRLWFAISTDTPERILIFGRNITDKVTNQKTVY